MHHFLVCARVIPSLACEQGGFCEAKSTSGSFSRPFSSLSGCFCCCNSISTDGIPARGHGQNDNSFREVGRWLAGAGLVLPFPVVDAEVPHLLSCLTWKPRLLEGRFHLRGSPTSPVDDSAGENLRFFPFFLCFAAVFISRVERRLASKVTFLKFMPKWGRFFFISKCAQSMQKPCTMSSGARLVCGLVGAAVCDGGFSRRNLQPAPTGVELLSVLAALTW